MLIAVVSVCKLLKCNYWRPERCLRRNNSTTAAFMLPNQNQDTMTNGLVTRFSRICLYIFFLLQVSVTGLAQSLTLTKDQMREDLDSLIQTIVRVSPHIAVKKDLWKYDAIREMNEQRKKIDTITSDLSFYILLQQTLNLSQDMHTSVWYPLSAWAKTQDDVYRRARNAFRMAIPNSYVNGKYIVREAFSYGKDTIPVGSEITHIDGESIDRYVRQHLAGRYYAYDLQFRKFYGAGFFKHFETIFRDSLTFRFTLPAGLPPAGISKKLTMPTREFTNYLPVGYKRGDITRVELWEPENILYIRLTEMNADSIPFLQRELARYKERVKDINRIIIDFRGNGGGDDTTWQSLYAAIIPEPVAYPLKISANKGIGKEKETSSLLAKYGLYSLVDKTVTLEPSDASLRFTGKIFVLFEDHYSSTGSAMIIPNARPDDNLIAIGRKTGYFLGVGYAPLVFTLPHTKLMYRVAPSIETTGATRAADLMHDRLEMEVPYDVRDFKATEGYTGNFSDKAYLLQYDPFIRVVMNN